MKEFIAKTKKAIFDFALAAYDYFRANCIVFFEFENMEFESKHFFKILKDKRLLEKLAEHLNCKVVVKLNHCVNPLVGNGFYNIFLVGKSSFKFQDLNGEMIEGTNPTVIAKTSDSLEEAYANCLDEYFKICSFGQLSLLSSSSVSDSIKAADRNELEMKLAVAGK